MPFTNAFMERFGLSIPIIQAPMLGATDSAIVRAAIRNWLSAGCNIKNASLSFTPHI